MRQAMLTSQVPNAHGDNANKEHWPHSADETQVASQDQQRVCNSSGQCPTKSPVRCRSRVRHEMAASRGRELRHGREVRYRRKARCEQKKCAVGGRYPESDIARATSHERHCTRDNAGWGSASGALICRGPVDLMIRGWCDGSLHRLGGRDRGIPHPCRWKPGCGCAVVPGTGGSIGIHRRKQLTDHRDRGGAYQDGKDAGKDEQHQGKQQLDSRLRGFLFGDLPSAGAHGITLDT